MICSWNESVQWLCADLADLIDGFAYRYSCSWPKKLIISKADLAANNENNLITSLKTSCTATGLYDIDINDYTCTRPCPLPKIPEPLLMTHNWTNTTQNAEYKDVLVVSCKQGQKMVSKIDFNAGVATNLISSIAYTCLITGWFNETIGSYTCTRNCGPPTNYSSIMKSNWNLNMTVVPYGTTFRCLLLPS